VVKYTLTSLKKKPDHSMLGGKSVKTQWIKLIMRVERLSKDEGNLKATGGGA